MKALNKVVLLAALSCTASAFALDRPEFSKYDHRIRTAIYNRNDVVQLDTVIGIQTHIEFEEGEKYLTHAFGDSAAYALASNANHFFVKPTADNADTNLTIVTDRRVYSFRLQFHRNQKTALATYDLSFIYPDSMKKKAQEQAAKKSVEDAFKNSRGKANTAYSMAGDLEVAPLNVWDDREFTYFKFPGNVDLPGIYLVDAKGNESIVNRVGAGKSNDIYAVQKVAAKWMLRLGDDTALAIYNDEYDRLGVANTTGTKSPDVKRTIKVGQ